MRQITNFFKRRKCEIPSQFLVEISYPLILKKEKKAMVSCTVNLPVRLL